MSLRSVAHIGQRTGNPVVRLQLDSRPSETDGGCMKFTHLFGATAELALVTLALLAPPATKAQTVISNETLVTTTFVVNKQSATAKCGSYGCSAKTAMFAPISVTCPAATGKTCTFHIVLDAKVATTFPNGRGCCTSGPEGFYQFMVDGVPPLIGPTDNNGEYLFATGVYTTVQAPTRNRQSYPASVLATVTNSSSSNHTISVGVGCWDNIKLGGCSAIAHWSTMRVDVFEP
jgi:hypothetical protein